MAAGTLPTKVFWALVAASALAAGAIGLVVGAFVVNPPERVREVIQVPPSREVYPAPTTLPKPNGPPPRDKAKARAQVIEAVTVASDGSRTPEERLSRIDNSEGLEGLRQEILVHFPQVPLDKITDRVDEVRFLNRTTAAVRYTIVLPGYSIPEFPNRIGRVVLVGNTWKVTRDTACNDLALGGVTCPR